MIVHTQDSTTPASISDRDATAAISLVHAKAPETVFGKFVARRPRDGGKYIQVNRTNADGILLRGGWTFLVDLTKRTVVRTAVDPENFDTRSAVRHGTLC